MTFGLKDRTVENIIACFRNFKKIDRVKVYGSRAIGNHKNRSDIDLAVWGKNLDFSDIAHIKSELEELPTIYKFDVLDYDALGHENIKNHIDRVGKEIYVREKEGA